MWKSRETTRAYCGPWASAPQPMPPRPEGMVQAGVTLAVGNQRRLPFSGRSGILPRSRHLPVAVTGLTENIDCGPDALAQCRSRVVCSFAGRKGQSTVQVHEAPCVPNQVLALTVRRAIASAVHYTPVTYR